jgi:CRP/FNR family cyclic AMP-dependent transcriptional regulator
MMEQLVKTELSHTQKLAFLDASDWVNDFNPRQLDVLANYLDCYTARINLNILTEGDINNLFCLICEGKVAVVKENRLGEAKELQTLGPGKFFGEVSFFDNGPCSASIVTQEKVTLLLFDKTGFQKFCDESPSLALIITLNLIKNISQRLRQTTGKLIDLI